MTRDESDPHRSLDRVSLLETTRDTPLDRSQLQAELDISRATAYRRTAALTDDDLLERTSEGYRTTGPGCAVVEAAKRFERSLSAVDRLQPMLDEISAPELARNVHLFADADLAVATPQNPNAPIESWLDNLESCDYFRSMLVSGCPSAVTEKGLERAQDGIDFEVIFTPLALEADRNGSEKAFRRIAAAETTLLYTHDGVPFTMGIIDETVIVGGFDADTSLPVASVTTDDPEARAWAESLYRRYRREADTLDSLEISLS